MTTSPHLIWLLSGVAVILIIATLIGGALRARLAPDGSNPVIENLNARIAAWWGMVVWVLEAPPALQALRRLSASIRR